MQISVLYYKKMKKNLKKVLIGHFVIKLDVMLDGKHDLIRLTKNNLKSIESFMLIT